MFNPSFKAFETKIPDKILVKANGMFGETEMVLPLRMGQFILGMIERNKGALIQNVFPILNTCQREFLISGMTLEMQDKVFVDNEPLQDDE